MVRNTETLRASGLRSGRRRHLGVEPLEFRRLLDSTLLITEVSASNDNGIRDEDGDRSDWIEIYNAGDTIANLDGWYLTDRTSRLTQWRFPPISIAPEAFHVVFASRKDRVDPQRPLHTNFSLSGGSEYVGLIEPDGQTIAFEYAPSFPPLANDVSFGVQQEVIRSTIVSADAITRTWIPDDDALGQQWTLAGFDDTGWITGTSGVGYGSTDGYADLVRTDIRLDMLRGRNGSAYIRFPFTLTNNATYSSLTLRMKYDDGFVAYLNGQEVARRNAPDELTWNSEAPRSHDDEQAVLFEDIDITQHIASLRSGDNILAVHGLNLSRSDSDFLIVPELVGFQPGTVSSNEGVYHVSPSPGLPNGTGNSTIVGNLSHQPHVPRNDQDIFVAADLLSLNQPPQSVTLSYRVMYREETNVTMFDDGLHRDGAPNDNSFGAMIPSSAFAPGEMVRYYITVIEPDGRTLRWPTFQDPDDTEQYFGTVVDDVELAEFQLPQLHLFTDDPAGADTRAGSRGSLFYKGEFYDNVRIDLHGRGSITFPKKSHDIDFNRDHRFRMSDELRRVKSVNLITNFSDRSMMRTKLVNEAFAIAGAGGHFVTTIRTQLNGDFYAVYDLVEDPGDRFLERIGRSPNGALYKMIDPLASAQNGLKETRKDEDHSDLQQLINGLALPPGDERTQFLYDNINLAELASFLAMLSITVHSDCCFTNHYMYRDTEGNGEWEAFPFDVDNSMGNWVFETGLRTATPIFIGRGHALFGALYEDPNFEQMYLRRLRTLMDQFYGPPGSSPAWFHQQIDRLTPSLEADARHDNRIWPPWGADGNWDRQVDVLQDVFLTARRNFLYGQTVDAGGPIPDSQASDIELQFGQIEVSPASGRQDEEFIQLVNPNAFAVDISDWQLTGDVQLTLRLGTVLPANGTMYLSPNVNAFRARGTGPSGSQGLFVQGDYAGRLAGLGGQVELRDPSGRIAATATFDAPASPAAQYLRITELMFNPAPFERPGFAENDDFEFVELSNTGPISVDLTNVEVNGGIQFRFADVANPVLLPGQTIVVVNDRVAFEARFGNDVAQVGQYEGNLSNGGERIWLEEGGKIFLELAYDDSWYPSTDGGGKSLTAVDLFAAVDQWSLPTNWDESETVDGTPGTLGSPIPGDANRDGRFTSSDLVAVFQVGEFEDGVQNNSTFNDGDWNGDGEFDSADFVFAFQLSPFAE